MTQPENQPVDLFVIGGGINGVGIARDAAGRGLSVTLAEMDDLASATSSASTKMFHGGLRYLEYFEFGLVAKALKEREVLLRAMPHISWPMRFVLPHHRDMRFDSSTPTSRLLGRVMPWMKGRRPAWLIRLGLFLYDTLGGRALLPGTRSLDLTKDPAGAVLQPQFRRAFEYSDCWVEDSRLVVLNARDAQARGAQILTRSKVTAAKRRGDLWQVTVQDVETGALRAVQARAMVNAAGPWVAEVIGQALRIQTSESVRLVRGSHIVTRKLYDHDRAYFLQGRDGRIIFVMPYEGDFTLIGTTDVDHGPVAGNVVCSDAETKYLCDFASAFLRQAVTPEDVVWSYSGVRPLYDDGAASASAATRDYVLSLNADGGAPVLNVFGGKITTYRKLAEGALAKLAPFFPAAKGDWTAGVPLPGGDFPVDGVAALIGRLQADYPFLTPAWAARLIRAYGTEAWRVLGPARAAADLGQAFGATLTEAEVRWMQGREFARTAEDVVWRRTRLGLRMTAEEIDALDRWMQSARDPGLPKTKDSAP